MLFLGVLFLKGTSMKLKSILFSSLVTSQLSES